MSKLEEKIIVYDYEINGTFDRKRLDENKKYRGDNYKNAHNWFNQIEPFKFTYTSPCLDWFEYVNVEINWNDFDSFQIERRYGPRWWLIGTILYDKETVPYSERWHNISIGEIYDLDLAKFIIWCEKLHKHKGLPITKISALSNDFNLMNDIKEIINLVDERKKEIDND